MRKHCRRTRRRESAPTLVAYYLNPEVSTQERMSVEAIRSGWAQVAHFDILADCRDMLALGAAEKRDDQTLGACELGLIALQNIKDRYIARKRLVATGDELQALYALVDVSEDFWKRQPGSLFIDAEAALSKARADQLAQRAAYSREPHERMDQIQDGSSQLDDSSGAVDSNGDFIGHGFVGHGSESMVKGVANIVVTTKKPPVGVFPNLQISTQGGAR